jgi:integrase
MHNQSSPARPRGSGALIKHRHRSGAESWYGKWWVGGRQVMRVLGPVRAPGSRIGLTTRQAEAALRTAMDGHVVSPQREEVVDIAEAGRRYLANREMLGLKPGTLEDYRSYLNVHLVPWFGKRAIDEITPVLIEDFIAAKREQGLAIKSIRNYLGLLQAIFTLGVRRGWASSNPVVAIDKPRDRRNPEVRHLSLAELESLIAAAPDDELGPTERALYLTAAMTGLRRGELLALRWQDVDWDVRIVRVRRTYTRGRFGAPKSHHSARAVPLADRVVRTLQQHHKNTPFRDEDDLVFCHPTRGTVIDPSKVRKRFQAAARRAGLRPVRFHDLRHCYGTRLASAGAPLRAIQSWMGHADQRTTLIYAAWAPDLTQGAIWAAKAFADPPTGA